MFPEENNEYYLVVTRNCIVIFGSALSQDESDAEYIQAATRDSMEMAQEMVGWLRCYRQRLLAFPLNSFTWG